MNVVSIATVAAGTAAVCGVLLLGRELRLATRQELRELLAKYNERYMEISKEIPLSIFTDDISFSEAAGQMKGGAMELEVAMYRYFQLCEEELNLWNQRWTFPYQAEMTRKRQSVFPNGDRQMWDFVLREWVGGIESNFKLRAFVACFENIRSRHSRRGDEPPFQQLSDLLLHLEIQLAN